MSIALERVRPTLVDNVIAVIVVLGAFATVLACTRSEIFDLDRFLVPKALSVHAAALLCLALLLPGWRRIELGVVDLLLALFLGWTALAALFASNRWLGLYGLGLSFSSFVVYLAARRVAATRGRWVVGGLAAAATLAAALGAGQAYGLDLSWFSDTRPPGGTFGNRNFLAHLIAISAPLLLMARLRARRPLTARLALAAIFVAGVAIVLTRSRAGWLGLSAALAAMAVAAIVGRRTLRAGVVPGRLRGALVALALGAVVAALAPNRLEWRSANPYSETFSRLTDYRGGSGRGRLIQYKNSLKMLERDPLFGAGPGNWFVQYPRVTTPRDPAFDPDDPIPTNPWPSSDWVTYLVERGPIAVLLLLGAGAATCLIALRRLRGQDPDAAVAATMLLGVLAAALVTGMFDAVLLLATPAFFVAASMGALLPTTGAVVSRRLATRQRFGLASTAAVFALLVTLVTGGQLAAIILTYESTSRASMERALRFDPGDYRLHLMMMRRGSCSRRVPHARAAASLMPYHAAPRQALAECGIRVKRRR
ncbi:MAG TPA: O-antigen ligase family protein [Longimicrobiales bacterium]|nr:O-antigen ligase family protein [Longimicrobiales bacterium]